MWNLDNVWYLPNNIDVRVCPKNGNTSLKAYVAHHIKKPRVLGKIKEGFYFKKNGPRSWREEQIIARGDIMDLPFRKGSTRYAVKRDPVKRFVSAVEMLQYQVDTSPSFYITNPSTRFRLFDSVTELLDAIDNNEVFDMHLMPQFHYMGHPDQYDRIWDLSELSSMIRFLNDAIGAEWEDRYDKHQWSFANTKIYRITDHITEEDIERIKILYKADYDCGWK